MEDILFSVYLNDGCKMNISVATYEKGWSIIFPKGMIVKCSHGYKCTVDGHTELNSEDITIRENSKWNWRG